MEKMEESKDALSKEIDSIKEYGIGFLCSPEGEIEQVGLFRFLRFKKTPGGIRISSVERAAHNKGELISLLKKENRELSQQK